MGSPLPQQQNAARRPPESAFLTQRSQGVGKREVFEHIAELILAQGGESDNLASTRRGGIQLEMNGTERAEDPPIRGIRAIGGIRDGCISV